ncbi:hypothetical protein Tsp_11925 [Trichinella spiralis]|uniref:hypothetical protein n=1 Tax=Trichinella spiralis TaxID=6334 RepID=UPI0001EFD1FF|nr:hypothetical protein Tsp_11925 [Trichinella spiralis]
MFPVFLVLERYAFETIVVLSLVATDQQHFTDYNMNVKKGNVSTSVGNSQMQSVIHHTVIYTDELHANLLARQAHFIIWAWSHAGKYAAVSKLLEALLARSSYMSVTGLGSPAASRFNSLSCCCWYNVCRSTLRPSACSQVRIT